MPYIGKSPHFGVRNRFIYTASGSETSKSGADDNGATLTFTDGAYVDVYLNGVLLKPDTDYVTSTANTIGSLSALAASDILEVIVYDVFSVSDTVSATSGGTFSGAVVAGSTLDMNGTELILDADGDSSITADTDDVIHFKLGGTDKISMGGANSEMDLTGTLGLRIIKSSETTYSIVAGDDGVATHLANRTDGTSAHGQIVWTTRDGGTTIERARITASGELQVGRNTTVADCGATLSMTGANGSNASQTFRIENNGENGQTRFKRNIGGGSESTNAIISYHNYWKFSNHSAPAIAATGQYHEIESNYNSWINVFENSHGSSPFGIYINYSGATPDTSNNQFIQCADGDGATIRMKVTSDGDITTSDDGVLSSDERLKHTITDATDKWEDVKKLKVRNFYWNEDYHPNKKDKKLLGFIAQEFETVFPSLVNESNIIGGNPEDFEKDEDGKSKKEPVMRKHIKQGTLIPILTKALQEAMTRIETLETKVKALEDA